VQNVSPSQIKSIADLVPDKKNARKHNPRNIGMITDAIGQVGVGRSGVIDEDGNILVGNGTYEALAELGIEKVKVVKAAGNEWVVVQREGLSEEQKVKMALYDNRTAELADWDIDVLKDIDIELPDVLENLFQTQELDELLDLSDIGPLQGEDEVPEAPEKAVTQPGQIYQLGSHRLMCGDSTDKSQVEKLMNGEQADMVFTDPPYNINYGNIKHPKFKVRSIANDDMGPDEFKAFCLSFADSIARYCDGCIYVFGHPGPDGRIMFSALDSIFHCSTTIIWNKDQFTLGRGKYQNKYEPVGDCSDTFRLPPFYSLRKLRKLGHFLVNGALSHPQNKSYLLHCEALCSQGFRLLTKLLRYLNRGSSNH